MDRINNNRRVQFYLGPDSDVSDAESPTPPAQAATNAAPQAGAVLGGLRRSRAVTNLNELYGGAPRRGNALPTPRAAAQAGTSSRAPAARPQTMHDANLQRAQWLDSPNAHLRDFAQQLQRLHDDPPAPAELQARAEQLTAAIMAAHQDSRITWDEAIRLNDDVMMQVNRADRDRHSSH